MTVYFKVTNGPLKNITTIMSMTSHEHGMIIMNRIAGWASSNLKSCFIQKLPFEEI